MSDGRPWAAEGPRLFALEATPERPPFSCENSGGSVINTAANVHAVYKQQLLLQETVMKVMLHQFIHSCLDSKQKLLHN